MSRPRLNARLYSRLDSRFAESDEDPRASLVNLVDVMLVFACGLIAALAAGMEGTQGALKAPKPVEQGREIARPADGVTQNGSGYDRVGEVYRDPKTGKLVLIEAARPGAAQQ